MKGQFRVSYSVAFLLFLAAPTLSFLLRTNPPQRTRFFDGKTTILVMPTSRDSSATDAASAIRIGFIGCGTIASAIATGIGTQNNVAVASIAVTRRSESKSTALQKKLGSDVVSIHDDNQEVVDKSDLVFITVLPQQTSQVLQSLSFDAAKHTLVSLVSTSQVEQLSVDSKLPHGRVYKMICLPAVATLDGVCLITPQPQVDNRTGNDQQSRDHNTTLIHLLESLGGMVAADTSDQMAAMMIPSGLMGTMYGILKNNRDFVMAKANAKLDDNTKKLGSREATKLVAKYYHGMLVDVIRKLEREEEEDEQGDGESRLLEELVAEQTPGGLNEQGLSQFEAHGGMVAYDQVQESLWKRLTGQADDGES